MLAITPTLRRFEFAIMDSPSKVRSARLSHKQKMMTAMLAAVSVGLCLLMALPALWLVVTGQGQVFMPVDEPEGQGELSNSKAYDSASGAGHGDNTMRQSGESPVNHHNIFPTTSCALFATLLYTLRFSSTPFASCVCRVEKNRGQPRRGRRLEAGWSRNIQ